MRRRTRPLLAHFEATFGRFLPRLSVGRLRGSDVFFKRWQNFSNRVASTSLAHYKGQSSRTCMEGADLEATPTFYTYGVTLKLPAAACNVESLFNSRTSLIVLFSWRVLCPPYMHQFCCSFVDPVTVNGTVRRTGTCISRITYHFSTSSFLSSISTTIPIMGQLGIHSSSPPLSPSPSFTTITLPLGAYRGTLRHTPYPMAGPTQPEIANGLSLACHR